VISNSRLVLKVIFLLLHDSPASELYVVTFRNTLCVPSSKAYEDGPECSEMSPHKIQASGNHAKEKTENKEKLDS